MLTEKIIQYKLVFKLNKESSLKSKAEIEKVFGFGKKVSNKYLSVYFLNSQNSSELPKKVAVIVGKKTHARAVERNKIKRRIKEIFRRDGLHAVSGVIIFSVFKPFAELSYEEARSEIDHAVGLLKEV